MRKSDVVLVSVQVRASRASWDDAARLVRDALATRRAGLEVRAATPDAPARPLRDEGAHR